VNKTDVRVPEDGVCAAGSSLFPPLLSSEAHLDFLRSISKFSDSIIETGAQPAFFGRSFRGLPRPPCLLTTCDRRQHGYLRHIYSIASLSESQFASNPGFG